MSGSSEPQQNVQEKTRPQDESDALLALLRHSARAESEDELLADLAGELATLTGADSCEILLRENGDGLILRASTTAPEFNLRVMLGRGKGLCGQALLSGNPCFVRREVELHEHYARYPGIDDPSFKSAAVLPFSLPGDPRPAGVVLLRRFTSWEFPQHVKRFFRRLSDAVGIALASYRKAYDVGTRANRLGALSEVSKTLTASPYVEEILQLLVNITAQQFDYRVCTVRLLDETSSELILRATQSTAKAYQRKRAIKLGESIAGRAISERQAVIVRDVQDEADYIGHDLAVEQGLRSMICVPLTLHDRAIGVMSCYSSEVRDFPPDEVSALETLAKQAAISIEHAKLQVRTTLMQEMHHRVKNNLQQIASLLRLQMRHESQKSLEDTLNDCLNRILAISAVHDLLSRDDLDHVGIRSVADTLVHHQMNNLILPDRQIGFQVRGDDVRLNMMQATQVALVLNELIQNAVEHGFQEAMNGEIHVTIEDKEGEVGLWVSNNGDPLPPGFDYTHQGHLGLQIVDSLVRSLGGRFQLSDVLGWTVAEVKFHRAGGE
jgi:two-component system, sensor histidine kinase PdtaS